MADTPDIPQGVSGQQPQINQQMSDAVSTMAAMAASSKELLAAISEVMKQMPTTVSAATREYQNLSLELKTSLEYMTNMKETQQAIASFARKAKAGLFDTKSLEHVGKVMEEVQKAQERIKELAGKGTKEWKEAERVLQRSVQLGEKYAAALKAGTAALQPNDLKEIAKFLEEAAGNASDLHRNLRNIDLGHMTRQVGSVSKAFAEMGIGKGFAAKVEKFAAHADIREKVRDMGHARRAGNIAAAQAKKLEIQEMIRKAPEKFDLGPEDLKFEEAGSKARKKVAKHLGLGKDAAEAFVGGDEAAAFKHGAGGMLKTGASMAAGVVEGGIGELAGTIGAVAAPLAAAVAVLEVLREGIDKTAKQNQGMEAAMGKAGLFTGGGGMAFTNVRNQLTPKDAFTMLGMSFERNLKIAQAMQEAGRGLSSVVRGEGIPTAGAQFGPGGFGQVQRAAMGAGRMAGFTDAESVQRTMRLVEEYGQTLESAEDFFVNVNKSANAAGLSTTKYISIIDDVTAGFDRMNKALELSMGMLGELSKTGRMGAAELKEYMDFLTRGGQLKEEEVPYAVYTRTRETAGERQQDKELVKRNLEIAARGAGLKAEDYMGEDALGKLQQVDLDLTQGRGPFAGMDETQRWAQREKLHRVMRATMAYRNAQGGDLIQQAYGETELQTPAERAALNLRQLKQTIEESAGPQGWQTFMEEGIGGMGANRALIKKRAKLFGMENVTTGRDMTAAAASNLMAGMRAMTALTAPEQKDKRAEYRKMMLVFLQLAKQKKIPIVGADGKSLASSADIDRMIKDGPDSDANDAALQSIAENMKGLPDLVMSSDETLDYIADMAGMQEDVTVAQKEDALQAARFVGIQTQTTGDMIANAFSKWFNNLVGGMGKIVDWIEKPSKAEISRAEQVYGDPKNIALAAKKENQLEAERFQHQQEMVEAAKKHDRDALDRAEAKVADTEKQMQALQDRSKKSDAVDNFLDMITPITGKGAKVRDMSRATTMFGGGGLTTKDLAEMTGIVPKEQLGGEVYGTLAGMRGVIGGEADKGTLTFDKAYIPAMMDQLGPLLQKGLIKVGAIGGATGGMTVIVNNTLNSADFSHSTAPGQMLPGSKAPESPTQPIPATQPSPPSTGGNR